MANFHPIDEGDFYDDFMEDDEDFDEVFLPPSQIYTDENGITHILTTQFHPEEDITEQLSSLAKKLFHLPLLDDITAVEAIMAEIKRLRSEQRKRGQNYKKCNKLLEMAAITYFPASFPKKYFEAGIMDAPEYFASRMLKAYDTEGKRKKMKLSDPLIDELLGDIVYDCHGLDLNMQKLASHIKFQIEWQFQNTVKYGYYFGFGPTYRFHYDDMGPVLRHVSRKVKDFLPFRFIKYKSKDVLLFAEIFEQIKDAARDIQSHILRCANISAAPLAFLQIPYYLMKETQETGLQKIKEQIWGDSDAEFIVKDAKDVLDKVFGEKSFNVGRLEQMANVFRRYQIEMVPGPSYDGIKPKEDMKVVLSKAPAEGNLSYTPNRRATTIAKMTGMVLYGTPINDSDFEAGEKLLSSVRLAKKNAHHQRGMMRWYATRKNVMSMGFKSSLTEFFGSKESKKIIYDTLISMVWNGTMADPKRLKAAEKIMGALGIDSSNIHSDLHRLLTTSPKTKKGKNNKVQGINLDPGLLKKIEDDTKEVQNTLGKVFEEKEEKEEKKEKKSKKKDSGKTPPHLQLLASLLAKEEWDRKEVESMCSQLGMLLNSALEKINDYSYEIVDDAVVEDDGDTILTRQEYAKDLGL